MRGADTFTESLFSVRRLDDFVPQNHPLRPVRQMVNEALKKIEPLLKVLDDIPPEMGGTYGKDLRLGLIIKSWNRYSDGKKITEEEIRLEETRNELNQPVLAERPHIGGIDVAERTGA